jgi:hypothetical protein
MIEQSYEDSIVSESTHADSTKGSADEHMAATERRLELAEDVRFEDAISKKLAVEVTQFGNIPRRQALLEAYGIAVDAAIAPSSYELEKLSMQDWETVKISEWPLLTLHAAGNYRREEAETTFVPFGKQFSRHSDPRVGYEGLQNRALIASLPLVHGLSAAAFMKLTEGAGVMQSNKTLYKQSGVDALTFHSAGVGATNLQDRELGLDQYVFFDFGHPAANHRTQPEITLVIDQSVMDQDGAFMTAQDVADTTSISQYMRGLTTPQYFRETALLRIHNTVIEQGETRSGGYHTGFSVYNNLSQWMRGQDGDFNQDGSPLFSTYEVKVPDPPGVLTTAIRRVIVRDEETFKHLQETMSDRFEFVHEPRLRAAGERVPDYSGDARDMAAIDNGNYPELLQISGAFEQKMQELIEAEYQERARILDGLPDTEKEHAIVIFGNRESDVIDGDDVKTRITDKTNPYQYNGVVAIYPSMEDMRNDVENTYDLRDFATADGQEPWFYEPFSYDSQKAIRTPSGTCVLAIVERSKQDPRIVRMLNARSFSLDELSGDVERLNATQPEAVSDDVADRN